MTCTGGRLARFLKWKVFRPSPVMSDVIGINDDRLPSYATCLMIAAIACLLILRGAVLGAARLWRQIANPVQGDAGTPWFHESAPYLLSPTAWIRAAYVYGILVVAQIVLVISALVCMTFEGWIDSSTRLVVIAFLVGLIRYTVGALFLLDDEYGFLTAFTNPDKIKIPGVDDPDR